MTGKVPVQRVVTLQPHYGGGPGGQGQGYGFAIRGPWVSAVACHSLAEDAGMQPGQRILCINGQQILNGEGTGQILAQLRHQGQGVTLLLEGQYNRPGLL